jgi:hypothetical protein
LEPSLLIYVSFVSCGCRGKTTGKLNAVSDYSVGENEPPIRDEFNEGLNLHVARVDRNSIAIHSKFGAPDFRASLGP